VTFQAEGDWNVYVQGETASLVPIISEYIFITLKSH